MDKTYTIELCNKEDREMVAMALYRAGYTVRECRRKGGNGKTIVYIEYWK